MPSTTLSALLAQVAAGELSPAAAERALATFGSPATLGYATVDTDRLRRTGYPEVIFGEGKTAEQITGILSELERTGQPVLATRVSAEKADAVRRALPDLTYNSTARMLFHTTDAPTVGEIAVVTAGTSDVPVAEEAAVTAEVFGNRVTRIYDVGVAGIHRLFARLEEIRRAQVVIVIAGMEGALASVVGGLVDRPVIAVPTSIGYGSSFHGVAALLTMLNSCAAGVSVVNIDNGFGAAYSASMINHQTVGEGTAR